MASVRQIHWLGEFAQEVLYAAFLWIAFTGGADSPHHLIGMPPGVRLIAILILIVGATTYRTRRYFRRREGAGAEP